MSNQHYILDKDKKVVLVDRMTWAKWFETSKGRILKQDFFEVSVSGLKAEVQVSTVFLGLDHQWGDGPPLIFETMIFGGPKNQYQDRYSTYEEALAGHEKALKLAKKHSI